MNQITKIGLTRQEEPPHSAVQRDPLQVNSHLQVDFVNVFGEPEYLRSPDWIWTVSNICFVFFQAATYRLLTVILAPLCSIVVATVTAILAFLQVWFARPFIKGLHLVAWFTRSVVELVLKGTVGPVFEMFGLVLSRVRLQHYRTFDEKAESEFPMTV